MKKILTIVLCVVLAVALLGCSGNNNPIIGEWKYVYDELPVLLGIENEDMLKNPDDYGLVIVESIEFKSDGTHSIKLTDGTISETGKYKVEDDKIMVVGNETSGDYVAFTIEGDTLKGDGVHLEK